MSYRTVYTPIQTTTQDFANGTYRKALLNGEALNELKEVEAVIKLLAETGTSQRVSIRLVEKVLDPEDDGVHYVPIPCHVSPVEVAADVQVEIDGVTASSLTETETALAAQVYHIGVDDIVKLKTASKVSGQVFLEVAGAVTPGTAQFVGKAWTTTSLYG